MLLCGPERVGFLVCRNNCRRFLPFLCCNNNFCSAPSLFTPHPSRFSPPGVAFVASVAASPGVEVEGDARENLIVVSRNLGSAMNELTSAASAFVSGEAGTSWAVV